MKDREHTDTLAGTLRAVWREMKSDESKEQLRMIGKTSFFAFVRVPLAFVLHPIAMTRSSFMIGSSESQARDWETARKLPKLPLPRGGQRLS